ncbi:hypothetical protein GBA52_022969 [Prunus armeniaca]|nr:hypothetical protein GBA52_022969 [Prunus armeniaca]
MELHPPTTTIDIEISAVDKQNICLLTHLIKRLIRCIYPLHGVSASITHLPRDELLLLLIAKNQLPNVKKKQQQEDKKEVLKKANHKTVAAVAVAAAPATITTFLSLVSPSLTFMLHDYVYAFVPRHSFFPPTLKTSNFERSGQKNIQKREKESVFDFLNVLGKKKDEFKSYEFPFVLWCGV